uniref:Uncharacterized protein n=1 Tax=Leptobrachium leishanense TaxID=445787 RepID=A0A8C5R2E7_9ANUR
AGQLGSAPGFIHNLISTRRPPPPRSSDPPLLLSQDELGEVRVQLVLLVDPPLLYVVPAFLLGDPQGAGDVISECPGCAALTSLQVADGLVVVLQLHLALAQEEVSLHRLAVQLQGVLTVRQSLVELLHLQVAQGSVCVVHRDGGDTYDGFAVTGHGLLVLPSHEQPVALLLQFLSADAFLGAPSDPPRSRAHPRGATAAAALLLPFHSGASGSNPSEPREAWRHPQFHSGYGTPTARGPPLVLKRRRYLPPKPPA